MGEAAVSNSIFVIKPVQMAGLWYLAAERGNPGWFARWVALRGGPYPGAQRKIKSPVIYEDFSEGVGNWFAPRWKQVRKA
jgi:hypothetical protein